MLNIYILVGGDWIMNGKHDFPETVGNVMIPTDSYFSEGVGQPPTSLMIPVIVL